MTTIFILKFASQKLTIYFGSIIFIAGIIGGLLNIIVFTTLKSFRQTTCAFFLTVSSIVNILQLLITPLVFILAQGFYIDPRKTSWFCKVHFFFAQWSIFISLSCLCLATIDQFLSMSKYRHLNNLLFAQCSIIVTCTFGFLHSIFILIYVDVSNSVCIIINSIFAKYVSFFQFPFLFGFLPLVIMLTFSVFSFINARTLASRHMNIIRLRRDRQLTAMVLVRVVYHVLTTTPYIIFYIYSLNQSSTNSDRMAYNELIDTITVLLSFSSFSSSFYIYCCVLKRFRKQVVYVLINIWMKRWRDWMNKQNNNVIVPSTEVISTIRGQIFVKNISLHLIPT